MGIILNVFEFLQYCLSKNLRGTHPVKVVEGGSELVHLLLGDALGVPRQDLRLHLVDGSGDGRQQQLPSDTNVLPGKRNDQQQGPPAHQACPKGDK